MKKSRFLQFGLIALSLSITSCDLGDNLLPDLKPNTNPDLPNHSDDIYNPENDNHNNGDITIEDLKDKKITLTLTHTQGHRIENGLYKAIGNFNKIYPNIHIDVNHIPNYSMLDKFNNMTDESKPNILTLDYDNLGKLIYDKQILPLDSFVYSSNEDIKLNSADTQLNFWGSMNMFSPNYYKGNLFSVPFTRSSEVAFYNKTIFDEFNLKVPETWDEVYSLAIEAKEKIKPYFGKMYYAKDGAILNFTNINEENFYPVAIDNPKNYYKNYVYAKTGKRFIEHDGDFTNAKINYPTSNVINEMNKVQKYSNDKLFASPKTFEVKYCSDPFKKLQSIYCIATATGSRYHYSDSFQFGVSKYPKFDNAVNSIVGDIYGHDLCLVNKGNDYEKLASWLLVRYLTCYVDPITKESPNALISIENNTIPVTKSAKLSKEYTEFLNKDFMSSNDTEKYVYQQSNKALLSMIASDARHSSVPYLNMRLINQTLDIMCDEIFFSSIKCENIMNKELNYIEKNMLNKKG